MEQSERTGSADEDAIDLRSSLITSDGNAGIYGGDDGEVSRRDSFVPEVVEEVKRQASLAVPLIAVNMQQYSLQVISVMFVGHLGELPLSGMGSTLKTLCGQAYGAKHYHMLGVHTQRAILILFSVGIPLLVVWFYATPIIVALGQDPEISVEADPKHSFSHADKLRNYYGLHVPTCWVLICKLGLGSIGASSAAYISNSVNAVMLGLYIKFSPTCLKT